MQGNTYQNQVNISTRGDQMIKRKEKKLSDDIQELRIKLEEEVRLRSKVGKLKEQLKLEKTKIHQIENHNINTGKLIEIKKT